MLVNNNYSRLANTVRILNDPTMPWGTLAEEIPTDIGRSYAGYKRGGVLEGLEKLRKELMTAAVWMFGMPAFNKLGNIFCEKVLKIPTKDIDFSDKVLLIIVTFLFPIILSIIVVLFFKFLL